MRAIERWENEWNQIVNREESFSICVNGDWLLRVFDFRVCVCVSVSVSFEQYTNIIHTNLSLRIRFNFIRANFALTNIPSFRLIVYPYLSLTLFLFAHFVLTSHLLFISYQIKINCCCFVHAFTSYIFLFWYFILYAFLCFALIQFALINFCIFIFECYFLLIYFISLLLWLA